MFLRGTLQHGFASSTTNFWQVALNAAPLMHRDLSLSQRCQAGLEGFLALDLFTLLADTTAKSLKLPKGSCAMAPQTVLNLQSASLAGVLLTCTKDALFEPYKGFGRLSELPVEQYFSALRSQVANSQLSGRAYFQASTRQSLVVNKVLKDQKAPSTGTTALKPTELLGSFSVYPCAFCKKLARASQFVEAKLVGPSSKRVSKTSQNSIFYHFLRKGVNRKQHVPNNMASVMDQNELDACKFCS